MDCRPALVYSYEDRGPAGDVKALRAVEGISVMCFQPYENSDPRYEDLTACGIVIGDKQCHAGWNFLQRLVDYGSAPATTSLPSFWGEQGIIQSQLRAV